MAEGKKPGEQWFKVVLLETLGRGDVKGTLRWCSKSEVPGGDPAVLYKVWQGDHRHGTWDLTPEEAQVKLKTVRVDGKLQYASPEFAKRLSDEYEWLINN